MCVCVLVINTWFYLLTGGRGWVVEAERCWWCRFTPLQVKPSAFFCFTTGGQRDVMWLGLEWIETSVCCFSLWHLCNQINWKDKLAFSTVFFSFFFCASLTLLTKLCAKYNYATCIVCMMQWHALISKTGKFFIKALRSRLLHLGVWKELSFEPALAAACLERTATVDSICKQLQWVHSMPGDHLDPPPKHLTISCFSLWVSGTNEDICGDNNSNLLLALLCV